MGPFPNGLFTTYTLEVQADYFLNGFSVKTIVLVGIYNQQFKGTILFMVLDFQGINRGYQLLTKWDDPPSGGVLLVIVPIFVRMLKPNLTRPWLSQDLFGIFHTNTWGKLDPF